MAEVALKPLRDVLCDRARGRVAPHVRHASQNGLAIHKRGPVSCRHEVLCMKVLRAKHLKQRKRTAHVVPIPLERLFVL